MPSLAAAAVELDPQRIREIVVFMVGLIASIALHEYGHARVADLLGERLPRSQGRVTLNPLAHADPIGTLLLPLIMLIQTGSVLGWGKPVQISLMAPRYRFGLSRRAANFLISAAGPMMNVLFALALSAGYFVAVRSGSAPAQEVLAAFIGLNILLAAFNLIPCPPLDGGALLTSVLGLKQETSQLLLRYGFIVLFILFVTRILGRIMAPVMAGADAWLGLVAGWAR